MGRKRYSSFVESSDDEFQLSEAEASPLFSRLKRPRRPHNKDTVAPSASPQSTVQHEDDASVVIPDSLDQDDKSIPESVPESVPHTPNDLRDEDTRETEAPSEKADDIEGEKDVEDDDDVVEIKAEPDDKEEVQQSPRNVPTPKPDKVTNSGRRQSRKVYEIESDSEEESGHDNDDDDAYNSAEDSPPEDDDDSEFDFSPQKPAKKKTKTATKRPAIRQKAQMPPTRKSATRKPTTRKLATKPGLAVSKTSTAAPSKPKPKSTSEGAKSRLGARLPLRGLLARSSASDRKRPQSSGKLPSAPMIRSGLSRKAVVPRLHAYLPR